MFKRKDGGPKSPVTFYGIEIKSLFSIGFLKFERGGREEFHTHAFDAYTWFLAGNMREERILDWYSTDITKYKRSLKPKFTSRDNLHRVSAKKESWCFTIRGPWINYWYEYNRDSQQYTRLTHGREVQSTFSRDGRNAVSY
jgi:hypothetical protein